MKYLRHFNESLENDIQSLRDIFLNLKDDSYKVEFFSNKYVDDMGRPSRSIRVKITNPLAVNQIINFTTDITNTLKEAVSLMQSNGYSYKASFARHGFNSDTFYIYLDERGLSTDGMKMDENWPTPYAIYLDFNIVHSSR